MIGSPKAFRMGLLAVILSVVIRVGVSFFWPSDCSSSPILVSGPLQLLVIDLTMFAVFRMSQSEQADDTYVWSNYERKFIRISFWAIVIFSLAFAAFWFFELFLPALN